MSWMLGEMPLPGSVTDWSTLIFFVGFAGIIAWQVTQTKPK